MKPVLPLYVGKKVMVFDPRLWEKNGGDSKTDSFFRKATIISLSYRHNDSNNLIAIKADVKFEHDGRESKGHFSEYFKEVL